MKIRQIAATVGILAVLSTGAAQAQISTSNEFPTATVGKNVVGMMMGCWDASNLRWTPATTTGTCLGGAAATVLGQMPMASSQPVAIASDQSPVAVKGTAGAVAAPTTLVGSGSLAQGAVNAATTATLVVAARTGNSGTGRRSVTLWNRTGSDLVSCGTASIVAGQGAFLAAAVGSSVTIDTQAAIYCIVPVTIQSISFLENF